MATMTTAQAKEQAKNEITLSCKITNVAANADYSGSLFFETNAEFEGFDKYQEQVTKSSFSINMYELADQLASFVPAIKIARAKALGQPINPEIIAMAMIGADVKIKRTLRKEGEPLRFSEGVYNKDTWETEFLSVKTNLDDFTTAELMYTIRTAPRVAAKKPSEVNPFNV